MPSTAIVWIRRDLRLTDNPALNVALRYHDQIVIAYIFNDREEAPWEMGAASRWWLHHGLVSFAEDLKAHGGALVIRQGESLKTLIDLYNETRADAVYWNRLYEPAVIKRDKFIKRELGKNGIVAKSFNGALLYEPWDIEKEGGGPYKIYTPFSRRYFQLPLPGIEHRKPASLTFVKPSPAHLIPEQLNLLPEKNWHNEFGNHWQPGEAGANEKLKQFLDEVVLRYTTDRDIPATLGVSRLSPHLHFGEISPRQVWHAVQLYASFRQREDDVKPYLKQLIWRDFAHHLLYHFPCTSHKPFREQFVDFQWRQNEAFFQAWCEGKTGIPLIDAGMRELWRTGWMHNRIRMLVASFLTKNGLVHWLEGAKWFWDALVDASLANNTMGWQWTAGCGVDAAPYFRIFSPVRQGGRFDQQGLYIKKWVPEIANLPEKYIHQPWAAPASVLSSINFVAGKSYPLPIVDLSSSRKLALERYQALKSSGQ
ncbi:MAG: deoxyribodipyrimidine photo-lyase [Gammaproteobacteria bacterium]|nr:deoxyribodipyrimidine photo-lyase [Gammaproteobacteria bacterium]